MATNPCAHEFIAVPRAIIDRGVTIMDIAKNLIDRGFHPPTVHWPVHDCLMIEPTETESKATLDAFCRRAAGDRRARARRDVEELEAGPRERPGPPAGRSRRGPQARAVLVREHGLTRRSPGFPLSLRERAGVRAGRERLSLLKLSLPQSPSP